MLMKTTNITNDRSVRGFASYESGRMSQQTGRGGYMNPSDYQKGGYSSSGPR